MYVSMENYKKCYAKNNTIYLGFTYLVYGQQNNNTYN